MTNVLIVEDEPAISDMERDFLEGAGYNPFIAENSEEALHMMRSEKIDAVIPMSPCREKMDFPFAAN
ncbi:MAG: hypothetical protein ACLUIQ_01355 [Dialister invisus]